MEQFVLDNTFNMIYEDFLADEISRDLASARNELEENQKNFLEALDVLNELNTNPIIPGPEPKPQTEPAPKKTENKEEKEKESIWDNMSKALDAVDRIQAKATANAYDKLKKGEESPSYKATPQYLEVTNIRDLPFPKNIIAFVKNLIVWLKNNILNFIDKILNIIRALFGLQVSPSRFTPDDLKLKTVKAKEIETKYMYKAGDEFTINKNNKLAIDLNKANGYNTLDRQLVAAKPIQLLHISPNEISTVGLFDSALPEVKDVLFEDGANNAKEVSIISIDTSKDLYNLKLSLEHFFDLFDNAFGSNDEKLFSIEDLEAMLDLFKDATRELFHGGASPIDINGTLNYSNNIDPNKIKDNLLRTKINCDNLKKAYQVTNNQINLIAKIIMNKNVLGVSQMGVQFAFLSSASYEMLSDLLEMIDGRIKEAKELEKKLLKMKKLFEKLVSELEKKRSVLSAVSSYAVTTIIQQKVERLYDGARYITQIVQLRLNALSLYLSEINDTRAIIQNLNAINETSLRTSSFKNKLKTLFSKR